VPAAAGMVLGLWVYRVNFIFNHSKYKVMAVRDRSIGSTGLEQGGPNLGNDYSRDITREKTADDTLKVIVPKDKEEESSEENKDMRESEKRNNENR
jgi:hypothetical protein